MIIFQYNSLVYLLFRFESWIQTYDYDLKQFDNERDPQITETDVAVIKET